MFPLAGSQSSKEEAGIVEGEDEIGSGKGTNKDSLPSEFQKFCSITRISYVPVRFGALGVFRERATGSQKIVG